MLHETVDQIINHATAENVNSRITDPGLALLPRSLWSTTYLKVIHTTYMLQLRIYLSRLYEYRLDYPVYSRPYPAYLPTSS